MKLTLSKCIPMSLTYKFYAISMHLVKIFNQVINSIYTEVIK